LLPEEQRPDCKYKLRLVDFALGAENNPNILNYYNPEGSHGLKIKEGKIVSLVRPNGFDRLVSFYPCRTNQQESLEAEDQILGQIATEVQNIGLNSPKLKFRRFELQPLKDKVEKHLKVFLSQVKQAESASPYSNSFKTKEKSKYAAISTLNDFALEVRALGSNKEEELQTLFSLMEEYGNPFLDIFNNSRAMRLNS